MFLDAFKAFSALPTHPVFLVPCTFFVDAFTFVLSTSAREQPSSCLIRDSGLGDGVQRAVCYRSLELHAQRWPPFRAILLQPMPSKWFTTVVLVVSHSKKNVLHHRRLTRLHTTRHFHGAGHVPSRPHFLDV